MKSAQHILIGKINSAHGIKGLVKLTSYAQNPRDILKYSHIFDANQRIFKLQEIGNFKGKNDDILIVKIDGVNDRNEAEILRNTELFIDYDQLPKTSENEFYYVDLIGLKAVDPDNKRIGEVVNVGDFGAGGVIELALDGKNGQKELQMLSFTDSVVLEVNIAAGYIKIALPDVIEVK